MIKSELVQRISAQNPHLYQRDVENIVNAILDEIVAAHGARRPRRAARLWRVLGQAAPGPHRTQSAHRRPRRGRSEVRAVLQDRQGNARAAQSRPSTPSDAFSSIGRAGMHDCCARSSRRSSSCRWPLSLSPSRSPIGTGHGVASIRSAATSRRHRVTLPLFALVIVLLIVGVVIGGFAPGSGRASGGGSARRFERELNAACAAKLAALKAARRPRSAVRDLRGTPSPQRLRLRPPAR